MQPVIRGDAGLLDLNRGNSHNWRESRYSGSIFLVKYLIFKDKSFSKGEVAVSKKRRKMPDCGDPGLLGREIGLATMRYHNTVAARLGLNPTDHRCLDLLHGHEEVTAGDLAEWTGLTTGAVTGMIDRLERAGFIRREAHSSDRRKVVIRPVAERFEEVGKMFIPLGRGMANLRDKFSAAELKVIMDYMTGLAELFRKETQRLRTENQSNT
jgi:DNA-binding MarR family transcriptional regulator